MKILDLISNGFRKISSIKHVIIFLLLFCLFGYLNVGSFIGEAKLKEISGGTGIIDMHLFYNMDTAYGMLDNMKTEGRQFYIHLLFLDSVFCIFFMLAHSTLITFMLEKLNVSNRWFKLNTLPVFRGIFDILENCFILIMILNYPQRYSIIATIATTFTTIKFLIYIIALAVLLITTILLIHKKIKMKII